MNLELDLHAEFGAFCADGDAAARFRERRIDPYAELAETIVLNFAGVRNVNTSFCNALVANLLVVHGPEVMRKLRFTHCRPNVQTLICLALDLGVDLAGAAQRAAAA